VEAKRRGGVAGLHAQLRTRHVEAIALPKTNSPDHVEWVVSMIERLSPREKWRGGKSPIRIIGMIESAEAMVRIKEIAASGEGYLDALLVGRSGVLWKGLPKG
jgi:citrate lyase subunit beta-like protein